MKPQENRVIVKWANTRGVLKICFCFKCSIPKGSEVLSVWWTPNTGSDLYPRTYSWPRGLAVTSGGQPEAVRDALSPRPRGGRLGSVKQEPSDAPGGGVQKSKAEVKGKKPTFHLCECPRRGLDEQVMLRRSGARPVSRWRRSQPGLPFTQQFLRPRSVTLMTTPNGDGSLWQRRKGKFGQR